MTQQADAAPAAAADQTSEATVQVPEQELVKMQERIAWLEQNLDDTNQLVYSLLDRLDKAERQIKFLASMQEAPAAVRPMSEETPPPHY